MGAQNKLNINKSLLLKFIQLCVIKIHGIHLMLVHKLVYLSDVPVKHLNEQVSCSLDSFLDYFMFQPNIREFANLKSEFVTFRWSGVRKIPRERIEQGATLFSSVHNSQIAVQVSSTIMDTFMKMWYCIDDCLRYFFLERSKRCGVRGHIVRLTTKYVM